MNKDIIELRTSRFKDAPWINKDSMPHITVLGVGGIGSNALFNLARSIPANYVVVDLDVVDNHNITTQFYKQKHIDLPKVQAIKSELVEWGIPSNIYSFQRDIVTNNVKDYYYPITITGFDNMKARKQAFETWKSMDNRELFIDGRLRATSYEVYSVIKGREEQYEATLFDDADIPDDPCTMKQTTFFGMLIGARITNIVANFLTNKYLREDVCDVPFKFKELGELCYVEIE